MSRNINVTTLNQTPIEEQEIEIVERKGIGHPDSISDGLAQAVSNALCKEYQAKLDGRIAHHNTDEVQITAGSAKIGFGGGEITKKIDILLTGRATKEYHGIKIDAEGVAIKAAKEFLNETLINFDADENANVEAKLGEGSGDLVDVFDRKEQMPKSNDTSFGVGFAPFSLTETLVLKTEELLNSKEFKKQYPAVGEDIKVMGLREKGKNKLTLTIAAALIAKYINSLEDYEKVKTQIKDEVSKLVNEVKTSDIDVEICVNTGDAEKAEKEEDCYLTITGTSAEMGDDGSVGRGNRCNGLITPNRPMSMEATSGKNPVNHVGKLYNLLSNKMANAIYDQIEEVQQVHIVILTQIGQPIDEPVVDARVITTGCPLEDIKDKIEAVINEELDNIRDITPAVINGELRTF